MEVKTLILLTLAGGTQMPPSVSAGDWDAVDRYGGARPFRHR